VYFSDERPPYVADVEGRARIEGVAASIHESYLEGHSNKVAEDDVFKTPCVVIIFDEAPRYREVQSKSESKHLRMTVYQDSLRASGPTEMRVETRPRTRSVVARQWCLLRNWYNCGTNNFYLTKMVRWKWKIQLDWVIQPVPHDLVRRTRLLRMKSMEQDFKYLYWMIRKIIFCLFTCKGT